MAKLFLLSLLSLCFLAHASQPSQRQSQCRIQNIDAIQPTHTMRSEAGVTEHWDQNNEQLECAGVAVIRYTIQPKGLLLPHFHNAPAVSYILQGRGIRGVAIPGCPESFQSGLQQTQQQQPQHERGQQQGSRPQGDQHQKIRPIRRGDLVVTPVGVPKWVYNDGNTPLVFVTLLDIGNNENQLDQNRRTFYLAGNPQQQGQQQQGQQGQQGQHQGQQPGQRQGQQQGQQPWQQPGQQQGQQGQQESSSSNIFRNLNDERLAEVFGARQETVRKMKGENDNRGNIIRVENELQVVMPPRMQQQEEDEMGEENGLEESSCNVRLSTNIDSPMHTAIYNPEAGRINRINGRDLSIMRLYNLNAERGVLRQNALTGPRWHMNSHSVVYATKGSARVQIVGNYQQAIFDGELSQGQVLVIPQNFAVLTQAGNNGFEWISFKTNDPAMTSPLAGRSSVLRGFPEDVLRNAFQMSREEVRQLKYNRDEVEIFAPRSQSQQGAFA